MRIKTILNHVHPLKGFVYVRVARSRNALHVTVEARKGSKGRCGGCGKAGPTYDTSRQPRHFGFVPLWGMAVFLLYAMRRIDCPTCGVVTEAVPWADGKQRACRAYQVFLATWARRLPWTEVGRIFGTSWGVVFRSVQWVVEYGLAHRDLNGVQALGIDEIAVWSRHRYMTVVYQIDKGCRRLLWIARARKKETLERFFAFWGPERTRQLRFICSDMWQAYISVIAKRAGHALHVLDRFHIVANFNKVIDKVRNAETREMARAGYEPILRNSRWCFLKRKRNLTTKQRRKLADVLRYDLRTVRTYLLGESLQGLWRYTHAHTAMWYLDRWCTRALRSRMAPIQRYARTLRKHQALILNYFRARKEISAGATEGLNLNAKLAIRKARGFRTETALEIALYHQLGRLPEPPLAHKFC